MMIKNPGYIPNNIPGLYSNFCQKTDSSAVQNKPDMESVGKSSGAVSVNMDTIEFSQRQIKYTCLSKARDQVLTDLNQDKDASFLDNLKAQINSDKYEIDSQKLAQIMLAGNK